MGAVLKHIEYYPFGTKRSDIGSFNDLKHNFAGQYEDDESDLRVIVNKAGDVITVYPKQEC